MDLDQLSWDVIQVICSFLEDDNWTLWVPQTGPCNLRLRVRRVMGKRKGRNRGRGRGGPPTKPRTPLEYALLQDRLNCSSYMSTVQNVDLTEAWIDTPKIVACLGSSTTIKTLKFGHGKINTRNYSSFYYYESISKITSLEKLDLGSNGFDSQGLYLLKDLQHLKTVILDHNLLKDFWIAQLNEKTVENLSLVGCGVKFSQPELGAKLSRFSGLKDLVLDSNQRINYSYLATVSSLLQTLSLANCQVESEVFDFMTHMTSLQHLKLSGNHIGDEGVKRITHFPALKELCLANCAITRHGLRHTSWESLPQLVYLDLSDNLLGHCGNLILPRFPESLRVLELAFCEIRSFDAASKEYLISMMLSGLNLSENEMVQDSFEVLSQCRHLKALNVSRNISLDKQRLADLIKLPNLDVVSPWDCKKVRSYVERLSSLGYKLNWYDYVKTLCLRLPAVY